MAQDYVPLFACASGSAIAAPVATEVNSPSSPPSELVYSGDVGNPDDGNNRFLIGPANRIATNDFFRVKVVP